MKNGWFLLAFFTLVFLFTVVSCRDNNDLSQPKPKSNSGARLVSNGTSVEDWEANLTWQQSNFINQQADPESITYALWNDERILATYLSSKQLSQNVTIDYGLFCFQVAAIGALHVQSIGASLAQTWVQMTYADASSPYGTDVMYNFNVGKQVALSNPPGDLNDAVYKKMFIDETNYRVPGSTYYMDYRGVRLYRLASGVGSGSFTLPGVTRAESKIYFNAEDFDDQTYFPYLLRHEFGHILQAEQLGRQCFYLQIVPLSILSAAIPRSLRSHLCSFTETDANRRSIQFHQINEPGFVWRNDYFPPYCDGYTSQTPCQ